MYEFFNNGVSGEFKYFSLAHIIPLLLLGGIIFLLVKYGKRIAASKHEERLRIGIGFVLLVAEMSYFWRYLHPALKANIWEHLPITICGWAAIFCSVMLFTKNRMLFNISYFWVLALSINALLTPSVLTACGPARYRFYQYWVEHIGIYVAVFYMIFVHKYRPYPKSAIPAAVALAVEFVIAAVVNTALGTKDDMVANYLFIFASEEGFSVADLFPKSWWLKGPIALVLVALLFFLAYLPWMLIDINKKKKEQLQTAGAQPPEPAPEADSGQPQ